ncbi:MAG TPA: aminoglycoside adenylyltransferase domain-containing protein [Ktedonobacterales bacterium]|nr:aminoglycoside adenylyltransferase domain-containing protein [Ktedonobacterales bacterium]
MQPAVTPYPEVNAALAALRARIQVILGDRLTGLYLYGSLVTGDFDPALSDIDLLAATDGDLRDDDFARLERMHAEFARERPEWDDRIEVAYLAVAGLQTFRAQRSQIAVISPGEPFHFKDAGLDWLVNWYVVREQGVALAGPPPRQLIAPIAKDEYLAGVRDYAREFRQRVAQPLPRGSQAYAILTMCRAYHTLKTGELASKARSAQWATSHWPEWSPLIERALNWRSAPRGEPVDHDATLPETRRFVLFAMGECERVILGGQSSG